MVVCYEQASGERDALLARALNPYTEGSNVLPMAPSPPRAAHVVLGGGRCRTHSR